jgi:hypothetical protein
VSAPAALSFSPSLDVAARSAVAGDALKFTLAVLHQRFGEQWADGVHLDSCPCSVGGRMDAWSMPADHRRWSALRAARR